MFFSILKSLAQNKSLVRTLMNLELKKYKISGRVLDIGGGVNPSYLNFLQKGEAVKVINLDSKNSAINFEKDQLTAGDLSIDCVLMFNILEHIYNHNFLAAEAFRVTKKGGQLLGFVPFLINYHPDPHDYFRYTSEALEKIFHQAGFSNIKIKAIGGGPFFVNFNNVIFIFPKIIRLLIFPFYYLFDFGLLKFRPAMKTRFALGYLFTALK